MRLFGRKLRKDTRGFSLVELICAVAILGAISTAIGGAMVTSANSYQRGTTEASVQQDSHFTANVIEGLLIDATKDVSFDETSKLLRIENVDYTHTIGLVSGQLIYTCTDEVSGNVVDSGSVLAEDVVDFDVDIPADFATSRNAQITIDMARDDSDISTVYNVTSRNTPRSSTALAVTQFADVNAINVVTLEPNQEYTTNVGVTTSGGASAAFTAYVSDAEDPTTKVTWTASTVTIKVGKQETGGSDGKFTVVLESSTGEEHFITVNVRRVTAINITYTSTGTGLEQDEVYEFTANVVGTNLEKVNGAAYDTDYKSPYGVTWDFNVPGATWSDYVEVLSTVEDSQTPTVKVKLKQKITSSLTVIAYAKHDDGVLNGVQTNKSGVWYDDVEGRKTINPTNFYLDADFKRGDDFTKIIERAGMWSEIQNQYGGSYVYRWYRACPAILDADGNVISYTGTWSEWDGFSTGDTPGFSAFRPQHLSKDLLPSESYAIEVKYAYGTHPDAAGNPGTINWPVADTPESEYKFTFTVPAAGITINSVYVDGNNITYPVGTVGISQSENLKLKKDSLYWFDVTAVAGHISKYFNQNNAIVPKLQIWAGSQYVDWVDAQGNPKMTEWGWNGGDDNGQMKLKAPGTPGMKYRLILDWSEDWYNGDYGAGSYEQYYDVNTGKGIIYFEVVE